VFQFYREAIDHKIQTIRINLNKDIFSTCHNSEMTYYDFLELTITKNKNFKLPWMKHEINLGIFDIVKKINNGCRKNKALK